MLRRAFTAALAAPLLGVPIAVAQTRTYRARGVVREIRRERRSITIHHEAIEGYMPEMTMPFDVPDLALVEGVEVGDRVAFTFTRERNGRHTLRSLRRLGDQG